MPFLMHSPQIPSQSDLAFLPSGGQCISYMAINKPSRVMVTMETSRFQKLMCMRLLGGCPQVYSGLICSF